LFHTLPDGALIHSEISMSRKQECTRCCVHYFCFAGLTSSLVVCVLYMTYAVVKVLILSTFYCCFFFYLIRNGKLLIKDHSGQFSCCEMNFVKKFDTTQNYQHTRTQLDFLLLSTSSCSSKLIFCMLHISSLCMVSFPIKKKYSCTS
jgi:hypothetical protein